MMKDFTTTSFGLIIAYLLPGLFALYGASSWSGSLQTIFRDVLGGKSDAPLALVLAAFALIAGLFVNSIRWLTFEKILCRKYRVQPSVIARIKDEPKLKAFLMVIEETFRYHQFYGSVFVMLPMLCLAFVRHYNITFTNEFRFSLLTVLLITIEIVFAAIWHQRNTGASGKTWSRNKILNLIPWICVLTPFGYLASLFALGDFHEWRNVAPALLLLMLLFGGLIIGANAVAALKRYCDRIEALSVTTSP